MAESVPPKPERRTKEIIRLYEVIVAKRADTVMQGDNRMTLVKRSQTPKAVVSLGTISVVAIVCLVAGAMLPSRI